MTAKYKPIAFAGLLAGTLMCCGCIHLPPAERPMLSSRPDLSLVGQPDRARLDPASVRETEMAVRPHYTLRQIEFSGATQYGAPDSHITLEYFRPLGERLPVVLILPMSGGNYQVERMFARFFARHQLAVVIAHRLKWKVDLIPEALDAWFRQTVFENQLALDWIETRPELDADRIALFGISLGGIRGVLLAATDPRVKAAVLGLTGGDLPYILAHTTENGIAKKRDEYLRTNCVTVQQFQERLRASITAEPNDFAPAIDPQSVLLVLGVFDHVVPFGKGWELRRNMGRPETLLLPTGHYTAALMIPYIRDQSLRFFQKKFALPATAPPTLRLASPRGATSS